MKMGMFCWLYILMASFVKVSVEPHCTKLDTLTNPKSVERDTFTRIENDMTTEMSFFITISPVVQSDI